MRSRHFIRSAPAAVAIVATTLGLTACGLGAQEASADTVERACSDLRDALIVPIDVEPGLAIGVATTANVAIEQAIAVIDDEGSEYRLLGAALEQVHDAYTGISEDAMATELLVEADVSELNRSLDALTFAARAADVETCQVDDLTTVETDGPDGDVAADAEPPTASTAPPATAPPSTTPPSTTLPSTTPPTTAPPTSTTNAGPTNGNKPSSPPAQPPAEGDRSSGVGRLDLVGSLVPPEGYRLEEREIDDRVVASLFEWTSMRDTLAGLGTASIVRESDGVVVAALWGGTTVDDTELAAGWNLGHCPDTDVREIVIAETTREPINICPSQYDEYVDVAAANFADDGLAIYTLDAGVSAVTLIDEVAVAQLHASSNDG